MRKSKIPVPSSALSCSCELLGEMFFFTFHSSSFQDACFLWAAWADLSPELRPVKDCFIKRVVGIQLSKLNFSRISTTTAFQSCDLTIFVSCEDYRNMLLKTVVCFFFKYLASAPKAGYKNFTTFYVLKWVRILCFSISVL